MPDYDNTNTGALFPQNPETDRHPNYTGELNVEGEIYLISAWNKRSKNNNNYKSLSITKKTGKKNEQPNKKFEGDRPINLDDIPF